MKFNPLFSIITPSLNRADMIAYAVESVLAQDYSNFEHIIIDGGSTDGTQRVLKKYPHLRLISEPDQGMYDALNKGLSLATGEIIGFLNTDDFYAPDIFSQIALKFSDETVEAVAGLAGIVQHPADIAQAKILYRPGQGKYLIRHTVLEPPIFNAYFFPKGVFKEIGVFDTRYKIAADRDFMLRFVLCNFNTIIVEFPVYYYLQHSGSMTFDFNYDKFRKTVDEHLLLSKSYIEIRHKFPRQLIKSLVELRTRETIRACAHCFRQKELSRAFFYLKEGFRYNPFWLIRFLKHAIIHPVRQKKGLPYKPP